MKLSVNIGLINLITIILVILKLCHVISWSWLIVISPLIIGWSIFIILLIFAIIIDK